MKIKHDFVTNSSTTSFVAWGLTFDLSDLKEKHGDSIYKAQRAPDLKAEIGKITTLSKVSDITEFNDRDDFLEDFNENVRSIFENSGLSTARYPYDDELMVGNCPSGMDELETLAQFKEAICKKFESVGINIKTGELGWIEEAWRDG